VLAQTFSIPDYAALHSNLDSFFIDRQSLVGQPPAITADALPVKVTTEEEALLGNVLNQMIRYNSRKINFDDLAPNINFEPTNVYIHVKCMHL
jgi:hypothetical protein